MENVIAQWITEAFTVIIYVNYLVLYLTLYKHLKTLVNVLENIGSKYRTTGVTGSFLGLSKVRSLRKWTGI